MAGITSLVVKIGAQDAEITAALAKLGSNVKRSSDELKKLGSSPVAQQAQQSLKTLDETIKQIQNSQSRLADRAKLAAAGIEAMGGPARLTKRELEQVNRTIEQGLDAYRALGRQAPAELQKVADAVAKQRKELAAGGQQGGGLLGGAQTLLGGLGVGALSVAGITTAFVAGGKAALDYADTLTKLSDKTGIAIVPLQRLAAVAAASGNDVEQIASAVNQFQKRVTEGADGTVQAVERIGLTVEGLRALSPDEQFFAIAKGIQSIQNPAEQTRTAMDLFGKSGAELLPTLKSDVDSLKDSTFKMSETSVKALDDFGDTMTSVGTSAVNVLGEIAGAAITAANKILELGGVLPKPQPAPGQSGAPGTPLPTSGLISLGDAQRQVAEFTGELKFMDAVVKTSTTGLVQGFQQGADAVDAIHEAFRQFEETKAAEKARQIAAEFEKWQASAGRVAATLQGYLSVADQVDGSTIESIRYLRQHGAAMADLAEYYDLTAEQADAVAKKLDFEALVAKASAGIHAKLATEVYNVNTAFEKLQGRPLTRIPVLQAGPNPQLTKQTLDFERGIKGVTQALALMSQIGGDSFGQISQQIGTVISEINLASEALTAFTGKSLTAGQSATLTIAAVGLNVISMLSAAQQEYDRMRDQIRAVFQNASGLVNQFSREVRQYVGRDVVQSYLDAIMAANSLAEAQQRFNDLATALNNGQNFMSSVQASVGLSQSQLDDQVARAREVLDYVQQAQQRFKDGRDAVSEYTEEQQLRAYYNWQKAMADAGNAAAKAWVAAHDAAAAGSATASSAMDALKSKRDSLAQSIANEAPEEVMGVIEAQTRGQIAALDAEMERQRAELETGAEKAADAVQAAFDELEIHIPIIYDFPYPGVPTPDPQPRVNPVSRGGLVVPGGVQYFDRGGRVLPFLPKGTDTVPAMLTPGEIVINAAQQGRLAGALTGGGGVTVGNIDVTVYPAAGEDETALGERIVRAIRTNSGLYDAIGVVAKRKAG